jgi:hypothetical protein
MSVSADTLDFSQMVLDILFSVRLEIAMFASAIAGYLILFSSRVPKDVQRLKFKAKHHQETNPDAVGEDGLEETALKSFDAADATLRRAVGASNSRAVLKSWNALKQFDQVPTVQLSKVVECMQAARKDSNFIVQEITTFFRKHPKECNMRLMNDILEMLGRRLDSQLMGKLVDLLPSVGLESDQRTYEILLAMHTTTRAFSEVQSLVSEMTAKNLTLSVRASLSVMKASLQAGNFEEAYKHFFHLKVSWSSEGESSAWPIPRHMMAQFVELACREHQVDKVMAGLVGVPLSEESFNELLSESIRLVDAEMTKAIEKFARTEHSPLPDSTYCLLIRGLANCPVRTKALVAEVLAREHAGFSQELALSVLSFCTKASDHASADQLLEKMKPHQLNVLTAFIRFYLETDLFQKAMCSSSMSNH